jgi:hypothetical protein
MGDGEERREHRRQALFFAFLALFVYNLNFRLIGAGDTFPARFLPFAVWNHGTLHLDPLREVTSQRSPDPYWMQPTPDGHWASLYPVVSPLLVSPLYLPAALWLRRAGESYERTAWIGELMEKLSASTLAAVTVGWMFLLLRRRLARPDAILLTLAFAFGTNTWITGSQSLWQHGTAELLLVGALWFLDREELSTGSLLAAGALAGLMAANRPPDLLFTAALGAYALVRARWRAGWLAAAAAVPGLLVAMYNLRMYGTVGGGYVAAGVAGRSFFSHPVLPGLAGLLASPGRGLLVYSPFFLFLLLFARRVWADPGRRALTACLTAGVILQLLLYASTDWRAGSSYGYRFLTDLVPALIWLLGPVLASLGRPARAVFGACFLFAVYVQAVGAFRYSGLSESVINDPADTEMRNAWKIEGSPILIESRQPRASFTLLWAVLNPP